MTINFHRTAFAALALSTTLLCAPAFAGEYTTSSPDKPTLFDDFVPLPSVVDWGGFYLGILGGGGVGTGSGNRSTIPLSGATIGLRGGLDMQFDNIVVGAALSVERSNIGGTAVCFNPVFTCDGGVQTLGRLEGRLGFATDAAMIYAKGGAAYAYGYADADPTYNDYYFGTWGWTIGAGMEVMLSDNISAYAEYSYIDLFEHTAPAGTTSNSASTLNSSFHLVNVGLNYRF